MRLLFEENQLGPDAFDHRSSLATINGEPVF